MKFDVKCVSEELLSTGEVYTVYSYDTKSKYSVIKFEGRSYMRENVKTVVGRKSILQYVRKSGFDNVNQWWDAIKENDALRGQLYHVTLIDGEDMYPKQMVLPGLDEVLAAELRDCDKFMRIQEA